MARTLLAAGSFGKPDYVSTFLGEQWVISPLFLTIFLFLGMGPNQGWSKLNIPMELPFRRLLCACPAPFVLWTRTNFTSDHGQVITDWITFSQGPAKLSNADDQTLLQMCMRRKRLTGLLDRNQHSLWISMNSLLNLVALVKRAWREQRKKPTERSGYFSWLASGHAQMA